MAGKVETHKGNGLTLKFDRRHGHDMDGLIVSITQSEATGLIRAMHDAMKWINNDKHQWEWESE